LKNEDSSRLAPDPIESAESPTWQWYVILFFIFYRVILFFIPIESHRFKMFNKHVFCQINIRHTNFFIVKSFQRPDMNEFEMIEIE